MDVFFVIISIYLNPHHYFHIRRLLVHRHSLTDLLFPIILGASNVPCPQGAFQKSKALKQISPLNYLYANLFRNS